MQPLRKYINNRDSHVKDICPNTEEPISKINRRQRSNDELTEVPGLISIIVALFLVIYLHVSPALVLFCGLSYQSIIL